MIQQVERRTPGTATVCEITRALVDGKMPETVLQDIARECAAAIDADGAYLETVRTVSDEVEVLRSWGWAPPVGSRVPYTGSLSEKVIETGKPELVADLATDGRRVAGPLPASCGSCRALAVPLIARKRALGALVLLRRPESGAFVADEVDRIRVLADLASLALVQTGWLRESERRRRELAARKRILEKMLEIDTVGIVFYGPAGEITRANRAFLRMSGYTKEDVAARRLTWDRLTPPEWIEASRRAVAQLRTSGSTVPYEKEYLRKDGSRWWGLFAAKGLTEREGFEFIIDITDRKKADAALRYRMEQKIALQQAIVDVAESFDVDEIVRRIAETAYRATDADGAYVMRIDVEPGELVVASAAGEMTPSVGSRVPYEGSFTERALRAGRPMRLLRVADLPYPLVEGLEPNASGTVIPLSVGGEEIGSLVLLRAPGRPPFGPEEEADTHMFGYLAVLAFRRIHLLEDSERKREELQRIFGSRERLIRGFTHDVKNPLGAADGFAQLLEMGVPSEASEEQLRTIARLRHSIRDALGLINDLLELARAEAGELRIEIGPVDVREATREVAGEFGAQAESEGLTMSLELPDDYPIIRSDAARVRQVLSNLLSNAVKYTPGGGHVDVRVAIRSREAAPGPGDWAVVDVRDNGPGIAPERQSKVFQEFTQLKPSTETEGAGIGLSISRLVARALGGDLTLVSEVGKGSTFTLWLPLASSRAA